MGATYKKRFLLIASLGFICAAILGLAMVNGAVATNISISSSTMKISVDRIINGKITLYGALDKTKHISDGAEPVTVINLVKPEIKNLCLVIHAGNIPIIGEYNVVLRSPFATADYINIHIYNLNGLVTLHNLSIGVDPPHADPSLPSGIFSVNADSGSLEGVTLDVSYISGDSLILHNSTISTIKGSYSCPKN